MIFNPYKPSVLFVGQIQTVQNPSQMPRFNVAFYQRLHCLLKLQTALLKFKNTTQQLLNRKWAGPNGEWEIPLGLNG